VRRSEVNRPTYDIVGELTRFDERDSVFFRERLITGSTEERTYDASHPELEKIDRRLTSFIKTVGEQADAAPYSAAFDPSAGLGLPDVVDGQLAPRKLEAVSTDKKGACPSVTEPGDDGDDEGGYDDGG